MMTVSFNNSRLLACLVFLLMGSMDGFGHTLDKTSLAIGVFGLFHPKTLEIMVHRPVLIEVQHESGENSHWVLVAGQKIMIQSCGSRVKLHFTENSGSRNWNVTAVQMAGQSTEYTLNLPGRIQRRFKGELRVTADRDELRPQMLVDLEPATEQILRAELATCRQLEALKAQAILIRTYLLATRGRHQRDGFDYCDTTHCQFFRGVGEGPGIFADAVAATKGSVLTVQGRPFAPMYTAVCGGKTLVGSASDAQGMFHPVLCSYCATHPLFHWTSNADLRIFTEILRSHFSEKIESLLGMLRNVEDDDQSLAVKRRLRIQLGRQLGWNIIRSNRYHVTIGNAGVTIDGWGSGHNMGLCQAGAIEQARLGRRAEDLLNFYFPGAEIHQAE